MTYTIRGALAAAALLLTMGCGDGTLEPAPEVVATVEIGGSDRTLAVGDTVRLVGVARGPDGREIAGLPLAWMSEAGAVAAVTGSGTTALVRAMAPGTAAIRASAGGKVGRVTLTVTPPPVRVDTVVLHGLAGPGEPQTALMEVGWESMVGADARVPGGASVTLPMTWASADSSVATVTAQGDYGSFALVRARGPGRTRIWAEAEGRRGSATIVVAPATPPASSLSLQLDSLLMELGKHPELRAWVWSENGAWVENPAVTWFSHDTTVVAVEGQTTGGRGRLTGLREGRARVTALSGGRSATAFVRVKAPGPVGAVMVTPRTLGVWEGQLFSLRADVLATTGGPLPGQPVTWTVEDPSVLDVDAVGRGRAIRVGTTKVFAESGGRVGIAEVRVVPWAAGPVTLRLLPFVEPGGGPRLTVVLGTTAWTDAGGVTRTAYLWLTGGSLTLDAGAGRYEQRLEVETVLVDAGGTPTVVRRETRLDRGRLLTDLFTGLPGHFRSEVTPGLEFQGEYLEAGKYAVRQTLGTAPAMGYLYVLP